MTFCLHFPISHRSFFLSPSIDDDQVKLITKHDLIELLAILQELLASVQASRLKLLIGMEHLQLAMAGKLFKTTQLEKRLLGLTLIKEIIARARTPARRDSGTWGQSVTTFSRATGKPPGPGLDENFLLKWVVDEQIVEELFGTRMHIELVTRADDILRFLSCKGAIKTSHLEAIWVSHVAVHDARLLGACDLR